MNPTINPFLQKGNQFQQVVMTPQKASRFISPLIVEGGGLTIYGERSMGKTSMLNYIANLPESWKQEYFRNHVFVSFNCQDTVIPLNASTFWIQVIKHLYRKLEASPIKDKCSTLLIKARDGVELSHNDFHEILHIATEAGNRIVLVLDDFDCLIRTTPEHLDNTRVFLQGFRSLTTDPSSKAKLVIATRYSLQELCRPLSSPYYSAFENGFTNYRLRSFSEEELLMFLDKVEQSGQAPFNSAERRYISYLSGLHPQLAQIAAAEIFDQRIKTNAPITDLESVGERFKSEARPVFESLWQGANEVERLLMMLVALQKLHGKVTDVKYDVSDLSDIFCQQERDAIELAERGLLIRTQANPPVWDLFSPIFNWWILKEIEATDPEQLDDRRKVWGNLVTQKRAQKIGGLVEWVKRNHDMIESLGQSLLRITGWEPPQIPGS